MLCISVIDLIIACLVDLKGGVRLTATLELAVLVVLHKGETQRVYERADDS